MDLFKDASTISQVSESEFKGEIFGQWRLVLLVGGMIGAQAIRIAKALSNHDRPLSLGCEYLAPLTEGEICYTAQRKPISKSLDRITISARQDDQHIAQLSIIAGRSSEGLEHQYARRPTAPNPDFALTTKEILEREPNPFPLPLFELLEQRPLDWNSQASYQTRHPEQSAWFRYRDFEYENAWDLAAAAVIPMDIQPWFAAIMAHERPDLFGVSLTLDLVFHQPVACSNWLLCKSNADVAANGYVYGQPRLWSEDGQVLVSGQALYKCKSFGGG